MKRALVLLLLACFCLAAQEMKVESGVDGLKMVPKKRSVKPIDMTLPESPLVVNGSKTPIVELGRVFRLNQRFFGVVVENPSDKDIEYDGIVINCNCTSIVNKVPTKGKIPAKGKLPLLIRLNAGDLSVDKTFIRMIRFDLKKYRAFQINFTGEISGDLFMTYYDDKTRRAQTKIAVGYIDDPDEPWYTRINIGSNSKKEVIELGDVSGLKNFDANVKKINDYHWVVELTSKKNMKPGVIRESLAIQLKKPVPEMKKQADMIFFPIEGIIGMQLKASADEIFIDPLVDKGEVIEKVIMIQRTNFIDGVMIRASLSKKQTPYRFKIDTLTMEETKVTAPDGVEVRLDKYDNGIYAIFRIERSKLTEEGLWVKFEAPKSRALDVRIALLGEKERAEQKAEAEEEKRLEEEERKAQAEQDAIE